MSGTCASKVVPASRPEWIDAAEQLAERDRKLHEELRAARDAEEARLRKEKLEAPVVVEQEEN